MEQKYGWDKKWLPRCISFDRQHFGRSISPSRPPTITEHRFEPQSPPRRLPGTFEYGYTYGSRSYRHDQTTFLGTPRLHTRYQPDHINYRHVNRSLHEPRRRQFSPFIPFQRHPDKYNREQAHEEKFGYRGVNNTENCRPREFPVNHDWDDAQALHNLTTPTVYSAGALVIWKENGYYGFLCDKNTLYGNLHFFADLSTVAVEEDNKVLGELPSDRIQRGHRVEIEAEFLEPDLSDPDTHHLIYVRKLLKIGSEASLERIQSETLVPLTKRKPSPYFRALSETGDLVYVHPSILVAQSLLEFMKQRLSTCRPPYVEDALSVICSNRAVRGDVTVAPRWMGDSIGRLCNFKRILLTCEPHGDVVHGYGTLVKVVPNSSITIRPCNGDDPVFCSLLSVPLESKTSYKIGDNVRYTACLDLPNSTYKWRCLGIARISRIEMVNEPKGLRNAENVAVAVDLRTKPDLTNCEEDLKEKKVDEILIQFDSEEAKQKHYITENENLDRLTVKNTKDFPVSRPLGYPAEANDPIPLCLNECPKKVFRYGDEPHCHFTIRDDVERSQYANFLPLYKSMEDFLLRHKRRRDKHHRRRHQDGTTLKPAVPQKTLDTVEKTDVSPTNAEDKEELRPSTNRFHFVGIGDDITQLFATKVQQNPSPQEQPTSVLRYSSGWWYRRTMPRIYPTVVIAEYITCRDKEKDCNENINVHKLTKTITIRNSGESIDDCLYVDHAQKTDVDLIVVENKNEEPNIMTLLQNDQIINNFFGPLLRKLPKS
ncbi:hypothetical protein RB195_002990 [Necator americanus]|uniref:Uncharacterized protein n=1 Tax=Necator americanus TaxID=51031 RepID=A0ABR1DN17_NECAM